MPTRTSEPAKPLSASAPPDAPPDDPQLVELLTRALAPSFTLVRRIGSGGMGAVYLARDPVLKRHVAVKVMSPALAAELSSRQRFEREAQAVASISHPNVVAVYSVGELANGVPYFVMQYVEGRTMAERLKTDGPLDVRTVRRVLGEVASALAAAHRKGIVHRDIKPANVLWDEDTGRALVTDFGIAAVHERVDERDATRITHTGMVVGTPAYMSPEQLLAEPITEKSDIYSLGLLGYELLTGDGPYQISSPRELVAAHLRDAPRKLSSVRADVDAELERLLEDCLSKDPARRPRAGDVESRLAHGASVLLEWPPPGLERLRQTFRSALRFMLIGGYGVGIPLVTLSVFEQDSLVRQTLPPELAILVATGLGFIVFAVGCFGLGKFFKMATKAVDAGYGWGTLAETAADARGDTGALITGGREYATLPPERRSSLRRYRVAVAAMRLGAALTPVLGYVIGVSLTSRTAAGPSVVLWSSLVLSVSLLIAARIVSWQEGRELRVARARLRSGSGSVEATDALARGWIATFEQVRAGQMFGAGSSEHKRAVYAASSATLVFAVWATLFFFVVQTFTTVMAIAGAIAVPQFGAIRSKIDRIERLVSYRAAHDSSITGIRAGQALHAISRAGSSTTLERWENPPPVRFVNSPPRQGDDPFPGKWPSEAFLKARGGFTLPERQFLSNLASNEALSEFRVLGRAARLDWLGAYWSVPDDSVPRWLDVPLPRFTHLRAAADANAAQAALDLSQGLTQLAEQRLRENINAGFLLIEHGNTILDNLIGATVVSSTRTSLVALYQVLGRTSEQRFVSVENDPPPPANEGLLKVPGLAEIDRMTARLIVDSTELRGLRWEMLLNQFVWSPCRDLHQLVFGADSAHIATLRKAGRQLVRTPSDSLLFGMVERGAGLAPVRLEERAPLVVRSIAGLWTTVTGRPELRGCLTVF